jgi:hypothetical protein
MTLFLFYEISLDSKATRHAPHFRATPPHNIVAKLDSADCSAVLYSRD